jgi:uncharacterized protein YjbI with pentapeptide repeats
VSPLTLYLTICYEQSAIPSLMGEDSSRRREDVTAARYLLPPAINLVRGEISMRRLISMTSAPASGSGQRTPASALRPWYPHRGSARGEKLTLRQISARSIFCEQPHTSQPRSGTIYRFARNQESRRWQIQTTSECSGEGVDAWNTWRGKEPLIPPDLGEAHLGTANLSGANLSKANLSGADLQGADLSEANLSGAWLLDANLNGADLSEANLSEANLHGADLSESTLMKADFNGASLSRANLMYANLIKAKLRAADFFDAPHCRGRRRRNSDNLTPTIEASARSPSTRSSGNSDNVRGCAAPSSKTSIDRRHANSCESLISPRYRTCRCTTRLPATRVFSTTLQ